MPGKVRRKRYDGCMPSGGRSSAPHTEGLTFLPINSASVNRSPPQTWGYMLHGEGVQNEENPAIDGASPSFSSLGKREDGGKEAQGYLLGGVRKRETYKSAESTGISSS